MLPKFKKSHLVLAVTLLFSITTWSAYQKSLIHAEPTHQNESEMIVQSQQIEQTPKEVTIEAASAPENEPSLTHSGEDNSSHIDYQWEIKTFGTIEKEYIIDNTLAEGEESIYQVGQVGQVKVEYELEYENDVLIRKEKTGKETIIQEPIVEIIHVGTQHIEGNFDRALAIHIFDLTNNYRLSENLEPLVWDEALYQAAQIRAKEISELFSHTRPDGSSWDSVSDDVMGENLAHGFKDPQKLVNAWVASPSHQENLVKDYTHMVTAAYLDESGKIYVSQLFAYR
ncbi:MAG TPA: CAP domain-containing protein [Erysipelothrix sp.]